MSSVAQTGEESRKILQHIVGFYVFMGFVLNVRRCACVVFLNVGIPGVASPPR